MMADAVQYSYCENMMDNHLVYSSHHLEISRLETPLDFRTITWFLHTHHLGMNVKIDIDCFPNIRHGFRDGHGTLKEYITW